jgi:hypothetical protein
VWTNGKKSDQLVKVVAKERNRDKFGALADGYTGMLVGELSNGHEVTFSPAEVLATSTIPGIRFYN